jgi:acetyl esterase/lipase
MLRCITTILLSLCCASPLLAIEPFAEITIWPSEVPGESEAFAEKIGEEKVLPERDGKPVMRITNVTQPKLVVYRPTENAGTAAVVVCPGGGYSILAWDLEGTEVAEWLNSIGVTAIVLKYRVPRRPDLNPHEAPLQDAQRAIRIAREHAREWKLDPNKIGILGFSAGGNLAAMAATRHAKQSYPLVDDIDKLSARPDFAVLIYPAYLVKDDKLVEELTLDKSTPPCFFAHAGDDRVPADNSLQMYLGLRKVGVPGELHIYPTGGHGFGLRPTDEPVSRWPTRCEDWMRRSGLL